MTDIPLEPPDWTNTKGVAFWADSDLNRAAYSRGLSDVSVWKTLDSNGGFSRVVVDRGTVVYAHPNTQCITVRLDIIELNRRV